MTAAPAFIVERYWPGASADEFRAATGRLTASVAELATGGTDIALLHATYVPADEAAQWVLRAPSAEVVERACTTAGLTYQRLLPAVDPAAPERSTT